MVNYLILVINDFDANIEFNYETETECKLPFLDVQQHNMHIPKSGTHFLLWKVMSKVIFI